MGFMETIWGEQKPMEEFKTGLMNDSVPFRMSVRFAPLRLSAMRGGRVDLVVGIENTSGEAQLMSIDAFLPRKDLLGFEATCITKRCEKRVGEVLPGGRKEIRIGIWGNNQTKADDYPIEVHAYSHYLNYNKVIHYLKKSAMLRVV